MSKRVTLLFIFLCLFCVGVVAISAEVMACTVDSDCDNTGCGLGTCPNSPCSNQGKCCGQVGYCDGGVCEGKPCRCIGDCGIPPCSSSCSCNPVCQITGTSITNPAYTGYTGTAHCLHGIQWCRDPDSGCPGVTCGIEYGSNCYNPETNVAPPAPSTVHLCMGGTQGNDDGSCVEISGGDISSANPHKIVLPDADERVYIKLGSVSAPAESNTRGVEYSFRIDNHMAGQTSPSTWSGSCTNRYAYDICAGLQSSRIIEELNVGETNDIGLETGVIYHVWGHSVSLDRCDDGWACTHSGTSCSRDINGSCSCDQVDGYFKINTPPVVVSVTPADGWSGTESDEGEPAGCSDNNPQIFRVTYSDADGVDDIAVAGLWIDNYPPSVGFLDSSMHGAVRKGSQIKIYAEGTSVGGVYPVMQLLIDDVVVRTFTNVDSYRDYHHTHDSFVTASQVKIRFANDKAEPLPRPPGKDRNLRVDKVIIDGTTYESEDPATSSNDCCPLQYGALEWLCCSGGYFSYSGLTSPSSGWRMFGLGYDASQTGVCGESTGPDCYKNYDWKVPLVGVSVGDTDYKVCSPAGSSIHNDLSSLDGSVQCDSDDTPVSWRVNSVSVLDNNRLEVVWEVWFYNEDISSGSDHVLDVYGVAGDLMDERDGWNDLGDWELDFNPPGGSVTINREGCDSLSHDEMCMQVSAYDNGTTDSGMGGVTEWWYSVDHDPDDEVEPEETPVAIVPPVDLGAEFWPISEGTTNEYTIRDLSGGDVLNGGLRGVYDLVCNVGGSDGRGSIGPSEIIINPGEAWVKTLDGDVYAALGFVNNIQCVGLCTFPEGSENRALSSYWIGGKCRGTGSWTLTPDGSYKGWESDSYCDNNKGQNWYSVLHSLAMRSQCIEDYNAGLTTCNYGCTEDAHDISGILSEVKGTGVYEFDSGDPVDVTISSGSECTNAKVIFIDGSLTIAPDFVQADIDSACLFIVSGNVTIQEGNQKDGEMTDPDMINAAFITDGIFTVVDDTYEHLVGSDVTVVDRLQINGFVFADSADVLQSSTSFNRDLVWENNMSYPAEYIKYDPRYTYLLKNLLGRRRYDQCECGICKDYAPCEGWRDERL